MATGTNLVIQQAGDIGRLQQMVQKTGELQQQAAALEQQQKTRDERSQVLQSEHSSSESKINKDGRQDQGRQESRPRQEPKEAKEKGAGSPSLHGKSTLDIIV
jgi:hypothetical protein